MDLKSQRKVKNEIKINELPKTGKGEEELKSYTIEDLKSRL